MHPEAPDHQFNSLKEPNQLYLPHYWGLIEIFLLGAGVIFLLFLGLGATFLLFDIPILQSAGDFELTLPLSLALVGVNIVAFALPVFVTVYLKKKDRADSFGFGWQKFSTKWLNIAIVLGIAAIFVTNILAYLVFLLLDTEPVNPQLDVVIPEGFSWLGAIGMTLGVGILVPIAEEMLFRGVIHRALRQFLTFWPAVLISSLLFGLFHVEPPIIVGAAVLGGICAWVYERSQSIWTAILIHLINNATKVAALYILLAFEM
jgi:membrane protease YdiL (CAAX protease family)